MLKPQLKTFLKVCETGSFSKAASALFITPSAVIQQINTLEKDLAVTLFLRDQKGVTLTPAGQYLFDQGRYLLRRSNDIRQELGRIASRDKDICVGTSLMEKCRLLYDLWVLFSDQEKEYEINMVSIDAAHSIPPKTDLIESVNSNTTWMQEWNFLEICKVPFGFAVNNDHPLAAKSSIQLEDLRNETVVSINRGTNGMILEMLDVLRENHISLQFQEGGTSALWESTFHGYVLVAPMCWHDTLINMTMRPCNWKYTIPYGIFYRQNPSEASRKFLEFIRMTYTEGNPQGIVPVLY